MLEYVEKLTLTPSQMTEEDIQKLQKAGWTDRDILDICGYMPGCRLFQLPCAHG